MGERIDEFVVDRLVRKFGYDMWEGGLEGKKSLWGFSHREYTTEELDKMIEGTTKKICNYFENKKKNPNTINTRKKDGSI